MSLKKICHHEVGKYLLTFFDIYSRLLFGLATVSKLDYFIK